MLIRDLKYAEHERCLLDVYTPETKDFPVVIYFHGGGLEAGSKDFAGNFAEDICARGYGVVAPNYRMYGHGGKFPDFLRDAAAAVAFVKEHIQEYGGNGKIYISGSSAGAWLSLMLCLNKEYLSAVGIDPTEIDGWIIDSAQTCSHYNVINKERGDDTRLVRVDEYAPIYFVNESTRFSKMLLLFYEDDIPCRPEENMLFYKNVLRFYPDADISYVLLPGGHCQGVHARDTDGEYPYVKETFAWLNK